MRIFKLMSILFMLALFVMSISLPFQGCKKPENDDCDSTVLYKPNIYIYPTVNTPLSLSISFPQGGKVIKSIPEYGSGWTVNVDTNGIIDNQYTYLFYESIQPNKWQTKEGWVVEQTALKKFFIENMELYGFRNNEIKDFVDYWIPLLTESKYYIIYPQIDREIESLVKLNFSKNPNHILRLYYLIKGYNKSPKDRPVNPIIMNNFKRTGFYVTEWGVIY